MTLAAARVGARVLIVEDAQGRPVRKLIAAPRGAAGGRDENADANSFAPRALGAKRRAPRAACDGEGGESDDDDDGGDDDADEDSGAMWRSQHRSSRAAASIEGDSAGEAVAQEVSERGVDGADAGADDEVALAGAAPEAPGPVVAGLRAAPVHPAAPAAALPFDRTHTAAAVAPRRAERDGIDVRRAPMMAPGDVRRNKGRGGRSMATVDEGSALSTVGGLEDFARFVRDAPPGSVRFLSQGELLRLMRDTLVGLGVRCTPANFQHLVSFLSAATTVRVGDQTRQLLRLPSPRAIVRFLREHGWSASAAPDTR